MRGGVAVGVVASLAALCAPAASASVASSHATSKVELVQVRSSFETTTRSVSRDIGISVPLPDGHAMWIFGDTGIWMRAGTRWTETKFMDGSSALLVNYQRGEVPRGGEFPTGKPTRFVAVPTNVYMPNGSGRKCQYPTAAFAARWPTGAAIVPSNDSQVLITYSVVCVVHEATIPVISSAGWGYELYNWRKHRVVRGPREVFVPRHNGAKLKPALLFGDPIYSDGNLTMFSSHCTKAFVGCTSGHVWSVTIPATTAALDHLSSYPPHELPIEAPSKWQALGVSVGNFPSGFRLIETTSIGGDYRIFSAPTVAGPWHLERSGTLPGCPSRTRFCFALEGHPELSTPTELFVSYKHPGTGPPVGHIVVSAIPD